MNAPNRFHSWFLPTSHSWVSCISFILPAAQPYLYWDMLAHAYILMKIKYIIRKCEMIFISTKISEQKLNNQLHACHSIFNVILFHMALFFFDVIKNKQNWFYYMHLIKYITIIAENKLMFSPILCRLTVTIHFVFDEIFTLYPLIKKFKNYIPEMKEKHTN